MHAEETGDAAAVASEWLGGGLLGPRGTAHKGRLRSRVLTLAKGPPRFKLSRNDTVAKVATLEEHLSWTRI